MLHGDSVGVARKAQGQQRHIEQAFVEAIQLLQAGGALAAQNANGLFSGKTVVASGNRGVGGEHAFVAHHGQV